MPLSVFTDDMSWKAVADSGRLFPLLRRGHVATSVEDRGLVISGGFAQEFIAPFYWFDGRMMR